MSNLKNDTFTYIMKKLSSLLAALVFVSLVVFISCGDSGGDDPGTVDPLIEKADFFQNAWTVNASQISYKGNPPDESWEGFQLTISDATTTGGNYSTGTTVPDGFSTVWPSSGNWTWNNTSGTEILRDGSLPITVSNLTINSVTLSFTIPETSGGRTSGIEGAWSFTFTSN